MGTDVILLRANLLGGMNSYILELGDEDIFDYWWACGVPDECDEETLMEIAADDKLFGSICAVFGNIVNVELVGVK